MGNFYMVSMVKISCLNSIFLFSKWLGRSCYVFGSLNWPVILSRWINACYLWFFLELGLLNK
jgi:hypothetical protein